MKNKTKKLKKINENKNKETEGNIVTEETVSGQFNRLDISNE